MLSDSAAPDRALLGWTLAALAAAVAGFALAGPLVSGDLFWHLSTGSWILDNGELPRADPFAFSVEGRPWTLEEYGAQIGVAVLERAGGPTMLRIAGALLAVVLIACVHLVARRRLPAAWAAAATALFAALFALKWELRPHVLSAFFILAIDRFLFARDRQDPGPREWIAVLLASALWTQLHAEAIFAPIFAMAGLIGAGLGALQRDGGLARIGRWFAVLVAATIGTAASPTGFDQHRYALSESSIPRDFIEEWFPIWVLPGDPGFAPLTPALFALVLATTIAAGAFVLALGLRRFSGSREGLPWERIGFLATCVLMAVLARRFFWLAWFPITELLATFVRRPRAARAWVLPTVSVLALVGILSGTHFVSASASSARTGRWSEAVDPGLFPVHAADFLAESELEGNLFHRYEWGGYLGWRLWPRNRVVIDGRTVLFAEVIPVRHRVERWSTLDDRAYAEDALESWNVRVIVMPSLIDHGAGDYRWRPPGAHEQWIRVWADATALVWMRADDAENAGRVRSWYSGHGIELEPGVGITEAAVLEARPEWIEERELLAPSVRDVLAPLYERPTPLLAKAVAYAGLGMRRSARFLLELHVRAHFTGDELELWLARIAREEPVTVLRDLKAGGAGL